MFTLAIFPSSPGHSPWDALRPGLCSGEKQVELSAEEEAERDTHIAPGGPHTHQPALPAPPAPVFVCLPGAGGYLEQESRAW